MEPSIRNFCVFRRGAKIPPRAPFLHSFPLFPGTSWNNAFFPSHLVHCSLSAATDNWPQTTNYFKRLRRRDRQIMAPRFIPKTRVISTIAVPY